MVGPRGVRALLLALVAPLSVLAACGGDAAEPADPAALTRVAERVDEVDVAIEEWGSATTIVEARAAAEVVSNAVTGPHQRWFGDADGDGEVGGDVEVGLLPGDDGDDGLALDLAGCAGPDLLGGPWDDPGARWDDLEERVATWTPSGNRFPELASHAQRVVGWARLTLGADDLDEAREHASHARLHVDAVHAAVAECG